MDSPLAWDILQAKQRWLSPDHLTDDHEELSVFDAVRSMSMVFEDAAFVDLVRGDASIEEFREVAGIMLERYIEGEVVEHGWLWEFDYESFDLGIPFQAYTHPLNCINDELDLDYYQDELPVRRILEWFGFESVGDYQLARWEGVGAENLWRVQDLIRQIPDVEGYRKLRDALALLFAQTNNGFMDYSETYLYEMGAQTEMYWSPLILQSLVDLAREAKAHWSAYHEILKLFATTELSLEVVRHIQTLEKGKEIGHWNDWDLITQRRIPHTDTGVLPTRNHCEAILRQRRRNRVRGIPRRIAGTFGQKRRDGYGHPAPRRYQGGQGRGQMGNRILSRTPNHGVVVRRKHRSPAGSPTGFGHGAKVGRQSAIVSPVRGQGTPHPQHRVVRRAPAQRHRQWYMLGNGIPSQGAHQRPLGRLA
jgi:hypothetical protein